MATEKKWYVVQAFSGYEEKVKVAIQERIRRHGVEHKFGDILVPREAATEPKQGLRKSGAKTFFPGYIFVQMDLDDTTWHVVSDTPRVSGFVGGKFPTPVSAGEIASIEQQVADGASRPKPRVSFSQNDQVRVTDGAFANFSGVVEEVRPEKQKVRVLVSIFGRATPVELDYAQVEKMN